MEAQAFHGLVIHEVTFDDFFHIFQAQRPVPHSFGIYYEGRAMYAGV
jgi:hypothetical protein